MPNLTLITFFSGLIVIFSSAFASPPQKTIKTMAHGITIIGLPTKNNTKFDIKVPSSDSGIQSIKNATNLIFTKSPYNANLINYLSESGKVIIIYDPAFPKRQLASQKIAAFFPPFFQHNGDLKQFRVVVGRYGIKWPIEKLAAVIVHELAGHGLQHLRQRTFFDRKLDRECEALIYEEKAYQDFNVPRDTPYRKRFLQHTRHKWCADFNRFLVKTKINTDEAWSYGKPDVPKLLNHFENYIKHLRKSGIAGSAIIETKKKQARDFEQLKSNAKQKNDPGELFIIGKRYFLGLGVEKNYLNALIWLNKAAYKNHSRAQFLLGAMYENGLGTEIDYVQAYKWFRLSMDGGFIEAKTHLNKLNLKISRLQRIKAQGIIQDWKKDNNFRN